MARFQTTLIFRGPATFGAVADKYPAPDAVAHIRFDETQHSVSGVTSANYPKRVACSGADRAAQNVQHGDRGRVSNLGLKLVHHLLPDGSFTLEANLPLVLC